MLLRRAPDHSVSSRVRRRARSRCANRNWDIAQPTARGWGGSLAGARPSYPSPAMVERVEYCGCGTIVVGCCGPSREAARASDRRSGTPVGSGYRRSGCRFGVTRDAVVVLKPSQQQQSRRFGSAVNQTSGGTSCSAHRSPPQVSRSASRSVEAYGRKGGEGLFPPRRTSSRWDTKGISAYRTAGWCPVVEWFSGGLHQRLPGFAISQPSTSVSRTIATHGRPSGSSVRRRTSVNLRRDDRDAFSHH